MYWQHWCKEDTKQREINLTGVACPTQLYIQTCLNLDVAHKQHSHTLDHFQTYQSHLELYSHAGAKTVPYQPSSFAYIRKSDDLVEEFLPLENLMYLLMLTHLR